MKRNFKKTFSVFKKQYRHVPLEVFGKDPYKTLVSTLLSSRTKDEVTLKASERLFEIAPDIPKLFVLKQKEIEKIIFPVGFYKTKAKYLLNATKMIKKEFGGEIPRTREELTRLPGVGRKTANLVLNRAFGIPAIAVDTHVHRISNILGWVKTKTPQKTEEALIEIVPRKYWGELNKLFVSIGRQYAGKRKLEEFLRNQGLL